MSSSSPKKKPRTRKLEKDRSRGANADGSAKKGSSRHAAAKKAASVKRGKANATAKPKKLTRDESTETSSGTRTKRVARKVDETSSSRSNRATPNKSGSSRSRSDRPQSRSERDQPRNQREQTHTQKASSSRATRIARGHSGPDSDVAPRARSASRNVRKYDDGSPRDERPARSQRSVREERPVRDSRPAQKRAPARSRRDEAQVEHVQARPVTPRPHKESVVADLYDVDTTSWKEIGVSQELLPVLARNGIVAPFAIQTLTLPDAISGRDILGRAQTGSGKTLAFGLAMLTNLAHRKAKAFRPLALVLVPTRELAMQVTDSLKPFAQSVDLDMRLIAGGMPYKTQLDALKRGVQILVATPGRLNDLISQGHIILDDIEITVLDEADQMCDMGFAPQIIEALDLTPEKSQRLLFSATLDGDVDKIVKRYLHDPAQHATATQHSTVNTMEHFLFVVHPEDKQQVVAEIASRAGKTMLFGKTQLGVERIARDLAHVGVACGALHGGKSQAARTRTLREFKEGVTHTLVATDVAARGIHVDGVSLVVHIDAPKDPKDYVHRAGRTARAGEEGIVATIVGPRQQKGVLQMMSRAGVEPAVVRIRPLSQDLVEITGAREPSGKPWHPPTTGSSSRGGRPRANSRSSRAEGRSARADSNKKPYKSRAKSHAGA